MWDTEGKKYLDFSAGIAVNALGHADGGVVEVGCFFWFRGEFVQVVGSAHGISFLF